jgi:hypothetical protein
VYADTFEVEIEPESGLTEIEGYDIGGCRWYSLDGERLRAVTDNGKEWGTVHLEPTGEMALPELEDLVRRHVDRANLTLEASDDFLIDAANAIEEEDMRQRKRPVWFERLFRLRPREPVRFSRDI